MKHRTRLLIRTTAAGAALLSIAPLSVAQTPTGPASAQPAAPAPISNEQASYIFGLTFGEQLHGIGVGSDLNSEAFSRGLKEGLHGKKSTPAEHMQIQQYVRTAMTAFTQHNLAAAQEFLASNGKKPGVQTTASGLEYKIEKAGDPKAPPITAQDEVTVNYRGTLLDGSEFDSTYSRGVPATFQVGGVIKGWQEALMLMKPGAKWTLWVPPELAYGPNPRGPIPGNSLLTFDVEVLSVKPKQPAPAPAPAPPKAQ